MGEEEPLPRVVRGTPTEEELAALIGALLARAPVRPAGPDPAPSAWVRSGRPRGGFRLWAHRGPPAWRGAAGLR